MVTGIAWLIGGAFFFLPALYVYFSFYVQTFGWVLGLILSVLFVHTLFPLHFLVATFFGHTPFWTAVWQTWGRVIVGSIIVWFISMWSRD